MPGVIGQRLASVRRPADLTCTVSVMRTFGVDRSGACCVDSVAIGIVVFTALGAGLAFACA